MRSPLAALRISGSRPTFPTRITLLTLPAMIFSLPISPRYAMAG
jgi:hypothetical protein